MPETRSANRDDYVRTAAGTTGSTSKHPAETRQMNLRVPKTGSKRADFLGGFFVSRKLLVSLNLASSD